MLATGALTHSNCIVGQSDIWTMISPFPKSASAAGEGHIVVRLLPHDVSALESITYQYPLKLISPTVKATQQSVVVFLLSYGGGLVGGDQVNLRIDIQSLARLSIVTQGHTKIFKPAIPGTITRQKLSVDIQDGAALCLLPDPVQPFEGSLYEQGQAFHLNGSASLCLLDWVTHGRAARGENWDLLKWTGRNEIWLKNQGTGLKDRLLVRDTVLLDGTPKSAHTMPLREAMHGHAIFGTLILRGPLTNSLGEFFRTEFSALPRIGARDFRTTEERQKSAERSALERWRATRIQQESQDGVLWSAANVRSCMVIKFGAATVEAGRNWIGSMLAQEASLERNFGEDALLCVR
ncbi:urease accessory protein ureD-like [Apiospora kogelbergensis]|uniref:Urease accessory protein ureD-like n=1 Tax=Apiospora kogelbergensis TaxID=1337665 RepID=A0AAW0QK47_9PEZI